MSSLPASTSVLTRSLDSDHRPESLDKYLVREGSHGRVIQACCFPVRSSKRFSLALGYLPTTMRSGSSRMLMTTLSWRRR
jgi:hypothetical protein